MADLITGNEGSSIEASVAERWMTNYIRTIQPTDVRSELFGINKVNDLLRQNGSDIKGIRICYALDDNGEKRIIIYAVNSQNIGQTAFILEDGLPCPPICGKP